MHLEDYLKDSKKAVIVHKPSILYGFIIGAVIATSIMFANKPMTFSEQLGCEKDESVVIDVIRGHTITSCKKRKKK